MRDQDQARFQEALRRVHRERDAPLDGDPGPWCAPSQPLSGIELHIDYEIDAEQQQAIARAIGGFTFFAHGASKASAVLRIAAGWSRIEFGRGMLGRGLAFVRGPEGALFLDSQARTCLHLAPRQLPQHDTLAALSVQMERRETVAASVPPHAGHVEGLRARIAGLLLDLDVVHDERYRPFAADLARALFGAEHLRADAFTEVCARGLPFACATRWHDGALRSAARWRVQTAQLTSFAPEVFAAPAGWTDLRDRAGMRERALSHGARTRIDRGGEHVAPGGVGLAGLQPDLQPAGAPKEDRIGNCFDATYAAGEGVHVAQRVLDHLRNVGNLVTQRLSSFKGHGGTCIIDWLAQFKTYSDARSGGDGVYGLLRWEPDPAQPASQPQQRYGGLGALDRLAEQGARSVLAQGTQATLSPSPALLAACNAVLSKAGGSDRFNLLSADDRTALRELYLERRLAHFAFKYPNDSAITEWPKDGDLAPIPDDLVRFKLYDIDFGVELQAPGSEGVGLIERLEFTAPHRLAARVRLHRLSADAHVLRWPGTAWGAFVLGAILASIFFPVASATLTLVAALGTWMILDAALIKILMRSPVLTIDIAWQPDAGKKDQRLWPTVDVGLSTSSKEAWYVSYVPDGVHSLVDAVMSLGLSLASEIEKELAGQVKDALEGALRDDLKLAYPGDLARLGHDTALAGAYPGPARLCLGAYRSVPSMAPLPGPRATQVDGLDVALERSLELDAAYGAAFKRAHPYAAFVWSQNLLDQFAWASWAARAFQLDLDGPTLATTLAQAVQAAMPGWDIHRDRVHVFAATAPRIELTPLAWAAATSVGAGQPKPPLGDSYARIVFDDLRLCMPASDERVLELCFSASAVVDVGLGALDAQGHASLSASPDTAFDLYYDAATVDVGTLASAGVRAKKAAAPSPQTLVALRPVLSDVVRAMLARRPATAIGRKPGDARNVQRYSLGPLALTLMLFPQGGNLYAYLGLPLLDMAGLANDPVLWLDDVTRIPQSVAGARLLLRLAEALGH